MTSSAFWTATTERALRTFAQTLVAALGLDTAGLLDANWSQGLSLAAGAAVLAILTAIATSGTGPTGPGLTETVTTRGGAQP